MKPFLNQDFLLDTEAARKLYHEYAAKEPIMDYHCHINPQEIYEDRRYENITQVWLGGDHYKWRLMRSAGIPERYITGDASPREKFQKWAETVARGIGNPLHHWSHLELRRYFGYEGILNGETAEEVWNLCNQKLQEEGFSVRGLIERSNVKLLCTTDDPIDSLCWHEKIAADQSFQVTVLPAWRPDKAMNLEKKDYEDYLQKLAKVAELAIDSFAALKAALSKRMAFFHEHGCRLSDHGIEYVMYTPCTEEEAEAIFAKRLSGQAITHTEEVKFKTAFMIFVGKEYHRLHWAMQIHYGCRRNNNTHWFEQLGPDTGFDCIDNYAPTAQLSAYLDALGTELPRTVLYSLNPNDDQAIDTIIGCFQSEETVSKIQHGSAWWYNDHFTGMTQQLTSLANLGYLAGFVGMLTDSRSFLSYPRHEYFRRTLCRLLGRWVEDGMYPDDFQTLGEIVRDISYRNAQRYFQFTAK